MFHIHSLVSSYEVFRRGVAVRFLMNMAITGIVCAQLMSTPNSYYMQKSRSIIFEANPSVSEPGEEVNLIWQVSTATDVYLTSIGRVAEAGAITVRPMRSTDYYLVTSTDSGMLIKRASVEVVGARGNEFPTDLSTFVFPLRGE